MEQQPTTPAAPQPPIDWEKMVATHLPEMFQVLKSNQEHKQRMKKLNRWIYVAVVVAILFTVSYLAISEIIDGATTGTIIGAVVGYTLGAVKEGFYD